MLNAIVLGRSRGQEKQKKEAEEAIKAIIARERPKTVIIANRWSRLIKRQVEGAEGNALVPVLTYEKGDVKASGAEAVEMSLKDTVRFLEANDVSRVLIVLPVPECGFDVPQRAQLLASVMDYGDNEINAAIGVTPEAYAREHAEFVRVANRLAAEFECVRLIDTEAALRGDNVKSPVVEGGQSLYIDDNHLSEEGAEKLKPLFEGALQDTL